MFLLEQRLNYPSLYGNPRQYMNVSVRVVMSFVKSVIGLVQYSNGMIGEPCMQADWLYMDPISSMTALILV